MRKPKIKLTLTALTLTLGIVSVRPTLALPTLGDFDTSFNSSGSQPGSIITQVGSSDDIAHAVAIQADGKIVTAGKTSVGSGTDFAVVRYNADGSLDTGFNGTGMTTVNFGSGSAAATGVVVQSDGKIVVAGDAYIDSATNYDFALARFNSDGSLDSGFGTGGKVTTDFGGMIDRSGGIALQADGKLVMAGYHAHAGGGYDYALARYNSDGSLDTSFGISGLVSTALGTNNDWPVTLALQPDGKIIIASAYTSGDSDFFVARYTTDGVLDPTFNPTSSLAPGTVTTDLGSSVDDVVKAVLVQPDGKIVAGGISGSPSDMALVRYNPDGSLDTSFGFGGMQTTNLTAGFSSSIEALALQPNGKIIAAGYAYGASDNDIALIRFDTIGTEVDAFQQSIGTADDYAYAISIQPDGKLVAAGSANDGSAIGFAVARYTSNDAPWDVTPTPFTFADVSGAGHGSVQTSNIFTISGLDSDTSVPITVSGGEYAINGSTNYTRKPGWVMNDDTVNVRHTAASGNNQTTDTVLTVGGIMSSNNLALTLGTTFSDTFTSLTAASSGGGSAFSLWSLAILIFGWVRRRVAKQKAGSEEVV